MLETFAFTMRTPEGASYEGSVKKIRLATETGYMEVLPGHARLVGAVEYTPLTIYAEDGQEHSYVVRRGILSIENGEQPKAQLMVATAELRTEMEPMSVQEYLDFLEEEVKKGESLGKFHLEYLEEEKLAIEKQIAEEKKQ